MTFSLLAPAALALGLLTALPLIAHMARQVPTSRQEFGAMLLLQRVVKRLRRRRRVKDRVLMALRIAAVIALTLAASGLRFSYPGGVPEFGGTGRVVVVVDRSLSMSLHDRGSTLLERARAEAVSLVSNLPEGTLVGLVVYSTNAQRLTASMTADHQQVLTRIREIQPSFGSSNLREALLETRRLLAGEAGEVLVLTDEAGPLMVNAAHDELVHLVDAGSAVIPVVIDADPPRNVAVASALYGDGVEGGQVTVRVANYGDRAIEVPCEVELPDGARIPVFVDAPPQGEAEVRITVPREATGGVGRASCEDPDLELDDTRYFHLPRVGASRVMVVDGDPGDTPVRSEVYFLERALAPWGGLKTGVTPDVVTPLGLAELDPEEHRVVFLANVADPRPFGALLSEFVRKGGSVVVSMGDNVTSERYNAALGTLLPSPLRKVQSMADPGEEGVALSLPDVSLPLFAPFARAGRSTFGRVRAHRVFQLEPYTDNNDVTTLLRFENGAPALVERRIGNGRVILWTGTMDLGWGNLPLQAAFMPLVQRLVAYLGGENSGTTARFESIVDSRVTVQLPDLAMEPDVIGPNGDRIRHRIEGSTLVFQADEPGPYELHIESAPPLAFVAVNVDPAESDVRPGESLAAAEAKIKPDLFLRHVDLGTGLMFLAFAAFVLQAAVAWFLGAA